MDEQDNQLRRLKLSSRLAGLSPAKKALLEKRMQGESVGSSHMMQAPIERVSRDQELPLSFLLESVLTKVWFQPDFLGDGPVSRCFRLKGTFNEKAMALTVNELARRHEALRTTFPLINGRPGQVIAPSLTPGMPVIDLQDISETKRLAKALDILADEVQRPYDVSKDTLWRVHVARLGKNDHVLLLSMSHHISDAWSMNLLIRDSLALYQAFSTGKPSPLPELSIQFADYAYWQRKTLQGQILKRLISYWKRQLAGLKLIPEIRLPIDLPVLKETSERTIAAQQLRVSKALLVSLKELSQRQRVSLFMLLLAALVAVLHRYTGKNDFGIPTLVAKRYRPETRDVIGRFADLIVPRIRPSSEDTFSELLQHVRDVVLEAYEHQDLPFSKFHGNSSEMWAEAETYPSILFNMLVGAGGGEGDAPQRIAAAQLPGLAISSIGLPQPRFEALSPPGLVVLVNEDERELEVSIVHELERHETTAIRELLKNYLITLEGVVVRPEQHLSEFPLVMTILQQ